MSDYVPTQTLPDFEAWLNSAAFASLFDIAFEACSEPLADPLQPDGELTDFDFNQWLHMPEESPVHDELG